MEVSQEVEIVSENNSFVVSPPAIGEVNETNNEDLIYNEGWFRIPGVESTRDSKNRIFVNRSLHLEKIKFYGFDMDYTIAEYCSPQYEKLIFDLGKDQMVARGYPEHILEFEYDPSFPVRGLWYDCVFGNLLKVDPYGNILVCVHGFQFLTAEIVEELYPNKFLQLDDNRIYILNTLFHLPEMYLLACIMDYFSKSPQFIIDETKTGVRSGDLYISYKSMFQDVRHAISYLHEKGELKHKTVDNLDYYIKKNPLIPEALSNISKSGAKVFLLTNSDFTYTNSVMTYLFDFPHGETTDKPHRPWQSYFDVIIVDGCKPLFFGEGTVLRQVDDQSGVVRLGTYVGGFKKGHIYSGGSCEVFMQLTKAKAHEVLYFGDHVFGDILRSKKAHGWRTFLIVPELIHELQVWTNKCQLFDELQNYDMLLGNMYKDMDSSTKEKPDITVLRSAIRDVTHRMDMSYGLLGSVFRFGSRQTFFSDQAQRFADLYSASFYNLIYYPLSYMFRAPATLMPHESTVAHEQKFEMKPIITRQRTPSMEQLYTKSMMRVHSLVPSIMPSAPLKPVNVLMDDPEKHGEMSPENVSKLAELKRKWEETDHKITFVPSESRMSLPELGEIHKEPISSSLKKTSIVTGETPGTERKTIDSIVWKVPSSTPTPFDKDKIDEKSRPSTRTTGTQTTTCRANTALR